MISFDATIVLPKSPLPGKKYELAIFFEPWARDKHLTPELAQSLSRESELDLELVEIPVGNLSAKYLRGFASDAAELRYQSWTTATAIHARTGLNVDIRTARLQDTHILWPISGTVN